MTKFHRFFNSWKHDVLAGGFAASLCLAALVLFAQTPNSPAGKTPVEAAPISVGLVEADSVPITEFKPTGAEDIEPVDRANESQSEESVTDSSQEDTTTDQQQDVETEAPDSTSHDASEENSDVNTSDGDNETTSGAVNTGTTTPPNSTPPMEDGTSGIANDSAGATTDEGSQPSGGPTKPGQNEDLVARANPSPAPIAKVEVEQAPIHEMSKKDVEAAVQAYEQCVQQGDVKLELDWRKLRPEQLHIITSFYFIRSAQKTTLRITPNGVVYSEQGDQPPEGKLYGDLPISRGKWPAIVDNKTTEQLGTTVRLDYACFFLSDEAALYLYRQLAHTVKSESPKPGSRFVIELAPQQNGVVAHIHTVSK